MTARFDPRPIARRFWERAGAKEPFPRRLTPTIAAILPVGVIFLPKLSVATIAEWLARRGAGFIEMSTDRPLRGCLIAQRGHAFIFVDRNLAEDEQRLTLAHETAHFLHHYEAPRMAAIELIGASVEPALDGDREPTPVERLRGALRGVPIGVYQHMLDRSDGSLDSVTSLREAEADLIGFELLAPVSTVSKTTTPGLACRTALRERFGLPEWAADRWAAWIDSIRVGDPLLGRLQAAREKIRH